MDNILSHFAIFTEDIDRAQKFYSKVFNWGFNHYGSNDFAQVNSNPEPNGQLIGALQDRKYQLTDQKVIGFECSISVDNVDEIALLVEEAGGKVHMPKTEIPHVGWIVKFKDTEGNIVCAMQYQNHIKEAMQSAK